MSAHGMGKSGVRRSVPDDEVGIAVSFTRAPISQKYVVQWGTLEVGLDSTGPIMLYQAKLISRRPPRKLWASCSMHKCCSIFPSLCKSW